jgi:HlyD family secretion protein
MRNFNRMSWFGLFMALGLLLSACTGTPAPGAAATPAPAAQNNGNVLMAEGRLAPQQYAELSFNTAAGGVVGEVLAQPGQRVQAGDVLLRLRGPEFEAALVQAQAGLTAAEARLAQAQAPATAEERAAAEARLHAAQALAAQAKAQSDQVAAGARRDEVTIAQEQVTQAEAQLRYAEALHDATMNSKYGGPSEWQARQQRDAAAAALEIARAHLNLVKLGATSNERHAAAAGVDAADAQVALAQADLDRLLAGASAEDLAVLEAGVEQARAGVAQAQAAVDNLALRAPFAGTIADVDFKVGERVNPGQSAVSLVDDRAWIVETKDLTEIKVVKLAVGQPATITLDALPGVTLTGKVISIGRVYVEKQGDVDYVVKVALAETRPEMRWGMTAEVTFGAGESR